ncbi:hypothetical protein N665_0372s0017 [Sinapis alba]|nr:hypothetical protein N665_0372s0017 [Sinapis alba]
MLQYQNCTDLQRYSSGFASHEVWNDYLKAHPSNKKLRSDTFEFFEELQIILGQGVATGKNTVGLGDGNDARTYKDGGNSNEEYVNDVDHIYEFDASTRDHELSEHYATFDSQTILNIIQQREERQQKEVSQKKINRIPFKALTYIYHLGIQDVFVKMSVEERLGWIQSSME